MTFRASRGLRGAEGGPRRAPKKLAGAGKKCFFFAECFFEADRLIEMRKKSATILPPRFLAASVKAPAGLLGAFLQEVLQDSVKTVRPNAPNVCGAPKKVNRLNVFLEGLV